MDLVGIIYFFKNLIHKNIKRLPKARSSHMFDGKKMILIGGRELSAAAGGVPAFLPPVVGAGSPVKVTQFRPPDMRPDSVTSICFNVAAKKRRISH